MDDQNFLDNLSDLLASLNDTDTENLTYKELADLLGVQCNEDGNLPSFEFFNACTHVLSNPAVKALSKKERARAIRSATVALANMRS